MQTPKLSTVGFTMPSDFPFGEYETVNGRIAPRLASQPELSSEFGGAWNAIAYRFRAMAEYEESASTSLAKHGGGPPHEERSGRNVTFAGYLQADIRLSELAFYALHFSGAFLRPDVFQIQKKRSIGANSVESLQKSISWRRACQEMDRYHSRSCIQGLERNQERAHSPDCSGPDDAGKHRHGRREPSRSVEAE